MRKGGELEGKEKGGRERGDPQGLLHTHYVPNPDKYPENCSLIFLITAFIKSYRTRTFYRTVL